MTLPIGTLLWWNRSPNAEALFWHEVARCARTVAVDELGPICRIAVTPPAGVPMASLLPLDLAYLEHGHQAERLRVGLARVLDGAKGVRVLAVGTIDSAESFAVATEVFKPDIVAGPEGTEMRCAEALRPVMQAWRAMFDERALRRDVVARYRIDEVVSDGLAVFGADASLPLPRIAPGRRVRFVLPGRPGGSFRVVLNLAHGSILPSRLWLRLDGRELDATAVDQRVEAVTHDLAGAACHVLEVGHAAVGELIVVGLSIGPA